MIAIMIFPEFCCILFYLWLKLKIIRLILFHFIHIILFCNKCILSALLCINIMYCVSINMSPPPLPLKKTYVGWNADFEPSHAKRKHDLLIPTNERTRAACTEHTERKTSKEFRSCIRLELMINLEVVEHLLNVIETKISIIY